MREFLTKILTNPTNLIEQAYGLKVKLVDGELCAELVVNYWKYHVYFCIAFDSGFATLSGNDDGKTKTFPLSNDEVEALYNAFVDLGLV